MGRVRALQEGDIPQVIDLHRRVPLPGAPATDGDVYRAYFKEMFLDPPWVLDQPSLVYEDGNGAPVGFLGIMPRRMTVHGRPISAVITAHFIVEPAYRASLAGIELIKTLLAGRQDLTVADEAGEVSRKLFEGLGARTALLYSLYWVRVLRPAEFAAARSGRGSPAWTALSRLVDAAAARLPGNPLRTSAPTMLGDNLDGETLAACVNEFTQTRALRPAYDGQTARLLLELLARKPGSGRLHKVLVRGPSSEIVGWYLYCGSRGGVGEVLQVGAREDQIGEVLDYLFAQARHEGMLALVGRIDPRLIAAYSARGCFFRHRGNWTLVHSRDPHVTQAFQDGDAFFSRLESEWYMRFQDGGSS